MSRYITNIQVKGEDVELSVGFDTNGKYFFDILDKNERLLDGDWIAKYSFEDIKAKAVEYGVILPTIRVGDFRFIGRFDAKTGLLFKNFSVMYLATKFDHIAEYLTIVATTEEEAIQAFKTRYQTYNLVEIAE